MKKLWVIPLLVLLLSGCGEKQVQETVSDVQVTPVTATMQKILIQLPPELSAPALQNEETGALYLCDTYSVTVQTVAAGDLNKTIRNVTGINREDVKIIETRQGDVKRYQWVWATGGENGIQVGRACVLDDGAYHYVLTALTDEARTGEVRSAWQEIFSSFRLTQDREEINTGS